jgi:ATP-binding cassette, subfamily B, bacterial
MKNVFRIIKISKPLHPLIGLISFLIVIYTVLGLVTPVLSKLIVDEIVKKLQDKHSSLNYLVLLIFISFLASVASIILNSISDRLGDYLAGRLRKFLTEKFYYKVLGLPQSFFDQTISGKIINQLNRGIQMIQDFLNTGTNFILPSILQTIFTIAILAYYNVPIAFFTFILFPTYIGLSYFSIKQWGKFEEQKNKIDDLNRGRVQEVILNIPLVRSFNNQLTEFKNLVENLTQINKLYDKQSNTYHLIDFARNFSLNIILLLVNIFVFYGAFKQSLTLGEMVLILQLIGQIRGPLFAMSFILSRVQAAESGSKEFFEILNLESTEDFENYKKTEKIKKATLEFKNVSFRYTDSKQVLENISFKLDPSDKVALVGHSGAGKTTIINLILKFYDPIKGFIYLNGKNYKQQDANFIRNNISLVFQESELFSSSIRDNVAYGNPNATEKEIINALKLAKAYDFVMEFPRKTDTLVGEKGVRLSGGQKQRIQIARAILKNSPIIILDEATSSLDAKSEKEVYEALENLTKDKLVIIIAHRFSTIQNVSKIVVINNGKISDFDTPEKLARKEGIYSELLHYQIEGNKKLLEKFELS